MSKPNKLTYKGEKDGYYIFNTKAGTKVKVDCEIDEIERMLEVSNEGDEFMCVANKLGEKIYLVECERINKQKTLVVPKENEETNEMVGNIVKEEEVKKSVVGKFMFPIPKDTQQEVFKTLSKLRPTTEKKGQFDYISWSICWSDIMKHYPNSSFRVIENSKGFPAFITKEYGGYVKVGVTIEDVERVEIFPIMNNFNKTHLSPTITDINKSLKRAMVKACAYFGYGLHLYSGEELEE